MGVLLFLLCLLCAVDIAQTQDCNDLSGRYFCIDNDTFKEQIDWCWCYYGDNPGKWILDPYAFVGGGYMATQLYFYPMVIWVETLLQAFGLMCALQLLTFQFM